MQKKLIVEMFEQEKTYWWHRAKRYTVQNILAAASHSRQLMLLDIGCGTGQLMEELKKFGTVYGVDISRDALSFCKKRGLTNLSQATLGKTKLPFKDKTFDAVFCLDVLEHIDEWEKSLLELKRVLKPQGFLIVTVPAYQFFFSYWDKMLGHKRRYTKQLLIQQTAQAGFFLWPRKKRTQAILFWS